MARRLLAVVGVLVGAWLIFAVVVFAPAPWAGSAPAHADAIVVLSGGRERLPSGCGRGRGAWAPGAGAGRPLITFGIGVPCVPVHLSFYYLPGGRLPAAR